MDLIIDRSKWLRGEGTDDSFLRRQRDGKMCCLGFLGAACGVALEDMTQLESPGAFFNAEKTSPSTAVPFNRLVREAVYMQHAPIAKPWCNTDVCAQLMAANDGNIANEDHRESLIRAGLRSLDVNVTFVDGVPHA